MLNDAAVKIGKEAHMIFIFKILFKLSHKKPYELLYLKDSSPEEMEGNQMPENSFPIPLQSKQADLPVTIQAVDTVCYTVRVCGEWSSIFLSCLRRKTP